MKPVEFQKFSGLMPIMDPAVLPISAAVQARDCIMWHGDIRALRGNAQVAVTSKVGIIKTIYRMGVTLPGDSAYWLAWVDHVDVARGAVANDTTERTYFTGDGSKPPQVTNVQMATSGGGNAMPNASYDLGVLQPSAAPTITDGGTGSSTIIENRVYVYTYVNSFGEEGPPSLASNDLPIKEDGSVVVSNMLVPPGGNYNYTSKRIYRSALASDGTGTFNFVAEIPLAQTSYTDTITGANLGEAIVTTTYFAPPATLKGLVSGANGMMAGFDGSDVYFCEPYLPYAWPSGYMQSVNFPVVGLGVYDQTFVVLTTGVPYLMTGTDPSMVSQQKADFNQSCSSKQSIAMTDAGVIWASPDGLCYMGSDGARVLTKGLFERADWQALNPSSIVGAYFDGHYVFTCTAGTFCFTPESMELTMLSDAPTAMYQDPVTDQLYFAIGSAIVRFSDPAQAARLWTWETKQVSLLSAISPSCARVDAADYPVTITCLQDGTPLPTMYAADGVTVIHPITVNDQRAFPLPSGFRPQQYGLRVQSTNLVRYFAWANDKRDLAIG